MGKPTGFMDYKRQELSQRPCAERIQDWEEIRPVACLTLRSCAVRQPVAWIAACPFATAA